VKGVAVGRKAWFKTLRGEEARELWKFGMYEYERKSI
jgi:hypothetical protein